MPYPHTFKQQTTVTVSDGLGHTEVADAAQIFKPLLAGSFNGPQSIIAGHSLPNQAASVLRALVLLSDPTALVIKPGPPYWATGPVPSMVLSEDPRSDVWWWHDAVPWTYAGRQLWSIFASKDRPASPPPPPPPPPPTPIVLGGSPMLATPISPGVDYLALIPPLSTGWAYSPLTTGSGSTLTMLPLTASTMGSTAWGGDPMLSYAMEGGPLSGPGTIVVAGASHTGPYMIYSYANPDPAYAIANWHWESP